MTLTTVLGDAGVSGHEGTQVCDQGSAAIPIKYFQEQMDKIKKKQQDEANIGLVNQPCCQGDFRRLQTIGNAWWVLQYKLSPYV